MAGQTALPSGIVTFVFTDIEGSTRLLRRLGEEYSPLLDRHLELMQQAWQIHHGHVIGTEGDGTMVAFQHADDAVKACAEAQRQLSVEPWSADAAVRVRMGIHTGLANPTGHDYRALAVHQAARVMSSAHGGQVLLTADTIDRLTGRDSSTRVMPLGRFRVRDFDEPIRLFQLAGEGLSTDFPAVRALPADGHNLIAPATSFVGRDDEVADVIERLGPGRLVTLAGPGGVGKTRLATQIGLQVADSWPDGAWFVDLSTIDQAGLIPFLVADALGVPERGADRWSEALEHLADKQALVILDNCEIAVATCAHLVTELLTRCGGCGALATSRVPLGTKNEDLCRVDPLSTGAPDGVRGAAIDLFLDRVAPHRRAAIGEPENARVVAEICERLDGLPLALELAAARMVVISPQELLEGLEDRFRVLRSSDPTVPERQRTLEALLDWSERLLSPAERACFHRLGMFGGSFSLEAATAAAASGQVDAYEVPEVLWALVDSSLVIPDLTSSATRYRMLESVREFALQRLDREGEAAATAERLATWFLEWLGPRRRHERSWISDVGLELDNLRALVEPVAPTAPNLAQQLAYTIARHLDQFGSSREAIAGLEQVMALLDTPTSSLISLHTTLADLHLRLGDAIPAKTALGEAEQLYDEIGVLPDWDDVAIERTRGELAARSGDFHTSFDAAARALAGDLSDTGRARMWNQLGIAALSLGDLDQSASAFQGEIDACRDLDHPVLEAAALGNLAEAEIRRGNLENAAAHQRACLLLALELGSTKLVAFSLILAARLAANEERWELATTLHSQAEAALDATGVVLYEDDQSESDAMLEAARHALGDARYGAARKAGHELELPEAAAMANDVLARAAAR